MNQPYTNCDVTPVPILYTISRLQAMASLCQYMVFNPILSLGNNRARMPKQWNTLNFSTAIVLKQAVMSIHIVGVLNMLALGIRASINTVPVVHQVLLENRKPLDQQLENQWVMQIKITLFQQLLPSESFYSSIPLSQYTFSLLHLSS